jgi:hypothetical protein
MEVNFRTTKADYLAFYRYYFFRRNLGWRILILVVGSLWFGNIRSPNQPLHLGGYLFQVLIGGVVIALLYTIPYAAAVLRLKRQTKKTGVTERSFTITLDTDGFHVLSAEGEAKFWRWATVHAVGISRGFVFILLYNNQLYLIARHAFPSANEADNFAGIIRNAVEKVRGNPDMSRKRNARRLRWWGLVGLVPNFGVIAGLILFFKGIFQYKDRWLVVIGVADVLVTVVFWIVFLRWQLNSATFAELWAKESQDHLNMLFRDVEFYKIRHCVYPDSLGQIRELDENIWINDPLYNRYPGGKPVNYFYEKVGNNYRLFSVGLDQKPFTTDDIFPQLEPADTAKFGLLIGR